MTNKDTEARGGWPAKHPVVGGSSGMGPGHWGQAGIPGKEGQLCGAHLERDGSGLQLSTSSLAAPCRYPGRLRWGQVKGTVPVPSGLCTPGSLGLGVPDGEGQATPGPGAGREPQGPTWTLDVTTAVRLGTGSSRRFQRFLRAWPCGCGRGGRSLPAVLGQCPARPPKALHLGPGESEGASAPGEGKGPVPLSTTSLRHRL